MHASWKLWNDVWGLAAAGVTRLEEWCVEATTPEEARAMLANGVGHRSTVRYLITATGGSIWSNVHCLGALSGRHRISFVP